MHNYLDVKEEVRQALAENKAAILPAYSSVETDLEIGILDGLKEIREFVKNI